MLKRALTTVLIASLVLAGLPVYAATGTALPFVKPQYFDVNGDPLVGAKLFLYTAGTSTKITSYSDAALTTPNANPVVLDSAGRASIFVAAGTSMKLVMAPSTDSDPPIAPLWTVDGVSAIPPGSTSADVDVAATAGENLSTGDLACLSDGGGGNTGGRWYKCDADFTYLSNLAPATGIANAAITTGAAGTVRRLGRVTGLSALVAGTLYYASATAGALTSTKPTNGRAVGTADSTTTLILVPTDIDASSTLSGNVSTGTQTIAGAKTLSNVVTLSAGATFASGTTLGNYSTSRVTSNFVKNNNTTLGDVTGLSCAIGANETWVYRIVVHGISNAAADFKFAITMPAATTSQRYGVIGHSGPNGTGSTSSAAGVISQDSNGLDEMVLLFGNVVNGANAGTLQLQAAQLAADVSNTTIYVNSYMICEKVG